MAYLGVAPEVLIERSDSKNPATTCKGITQAGRPCRRTIQAISVNDDSRSPKRKDGDNGVVAILDGGDAAAFFCHDHKDQADALVAKLKQQKRTKIVPLQHKSSIDTLAEKVGVLDLNAEVERRKKQHIPRPGHPPAPQHVKKRNTLPQEWQNMQSPLMSLPHDVVQNYMGVTKPGKPQDRLGSRYGRSNVKASWGCCLRADDEDDSPPMRPRRPRPSNHTRPQSNAQRPRPAMQNNNILPAAHLQQGRLTPTHAPLRPTSSPHAQTANYLSFIPSNLAPTTASALLAELSKPISSADEAGYIYIFWLTPESEQSKPDDDIASSLLDDDDYMADTLGTRSRRVSGQQKEQRTAQALQRYASTRRGPAEPRKILLKIGRANNVHRRMSQWTKQCGQQITLVRYYPYHRDAAAAVASPAGAMVPHVHKVERLIHIELGDLRAVDKGPCPQCGREHREWFEVEATRRAIKDVDRTIRRWVDWAERVG